VPPAMAPGCAVSARVGAHLTGTQYFWCPLTHSINGHYFRKARYPRKAGYPTIVGEILMSPTR
jgi:hypothetical protein